VAKRREISIISLSFLDAITCGFGAIILFYMIITAQVDIRRENTLEVPQAEVDRVELQLIVGRRNLAQLKAELERLVKEWAASRAAREEIVDEIARTQEELEELTAGSDARTDLIEQLRRDLAALSAQTESAAESPTPEDAGNFIRQVRGEGYRQYLTGLRMGGERILILVDASTSMLDRTLVNILRRRNMSEAQQRNAPKWQQVVNTIDWLTAQIPATSQFQVIAFNDDAWSLVEGTEGQWIQASGDTLDQAVDAMRALTPAGGTSLHAAFEAANALEPKPDNIYLLVDGLPTRGEVIPARAGVTGRERLNHFDRAMRNAPFNVPMNIILFPMEGDPLAGPAYWTLALRSGGSMMAPSEDWP
jgi:signal transduction histidine kinase